MGDGDRRPFPLLAAYARRRARACHARQARGRHFSSSGAARGGKEAVERSGRSCRSASSLRRSRPPEHRHHWLRALGPLVAGSLVLAASVLANRR